MNKRLKVILQNAVYTALYVVLCIVFQPISYGAVQVRIAEALCIMPLFDEFAVVLGIEPDEVTGFITDRLNRAKA